MQSLIVLFLGHIHYNYHQNHHPRPFIHSFSKSLLQGSILALTVNKTEKNILTLWNLQSIGLRREKTKQNKYASYIAF